MYYLKLSENSFFRSKASIKSSSSCLATATYEISSKSHNKNQKSVYFRNCSALSKSAPSFSNLLMPIKFQNFIPPHISPSRPIFLFRLDLNYEENIFFKFALSLPITPIFIYCYSPKEEKNSSLKRINFLKKTLKNLKERLSSVKLDLFIFNNEALTMIPNLARKYKTRDILYSFNVFCHFNAKKERKFIARLQKIGIKPKIFLFEPLTMTSVNFYKKKKPYSLNNMSFGKILLNYINLKSSSLIEVNFKTKFKPMQFKSYFFSNSVGIFSLEGVKLNNSNIGPRKNMYGKFYEKLNSKCLILKKIYSEFNLGCRKSFNELPKDPLVLNILQGMIILKFFSNSFLFLQNFIDKKFLLQYISNFS